jgi:hypothetical protein
MAFSKANISDPTRLMKHSLLHAMQREFGVIRDKLIQEYQEKLKSALVEVASKYTIRIDQEFNHMRNGHDLNIQLMWPEEGDGKETAQTENSS